jgi:hypothetical protein
MSSRWSSSRGRISVISPDGVRLAWIQGDVLRIRRLDDLRTVDVDMARVAGQEVADSSTRAFMWSADSAQLAFSTARRIWRVPAAGGAPSPICDIPDSGSMIGGDWGSDDRIVFSVWRGSIYRVSAGGGRPELVLGVDAAKEVDFHRPRLLPDGHGLLFNTHWRDQGYVSTDVMVGGRRRVSLKENGFTFTHAVYVPTGFVVFDNNDEEGIWAVPFSLKTLAATTKPFSVVGDGTHPSVSADGTLVYVRGAQAAASDRGGGQRHAPARARRAAIGSGVADTSYSSGNFPERLSFQQLHRHERDPAVRTDVVDDDDVGVREGRQSPGLPLEARQRVRVARALLAKDLDRDLSIQTGVSRPEDFSHSSFSEG